VKPHEFGIFVRSAGQLDRAKVAVEKAGQTFLVLDEVGDATKGTSP